MRLLNKVCLITGAGSGIGFPIVERFISEGAKVMAVGHSDLNALYELAERVVNGCLAVDHFDITDQLVVQSIVHKTLQTFGTIDVLVANAGQTLRTNVVDCEENDWIRIIDINLTGTYRLVRAVIPHMVERGGGAIVAIGSVGTTVAWPDEAAYIASKSGLAGLIRSIAVDYSRKNIRANCLSPGLIDAGMLKRWLDHGGKRELLLKDMLRDIPMGRLGTAEEISAAAAFLASDEASYITGSTIFVDGGYTAR